jgi:hypothetical protein
MIPDYWTRGIAAALRQAFVNISGRPHRLPGWIAKHCRVGCDPRGGLGGPGESGRSMINCSQYIFYFGVGGDRYWVILRDSSKEEFDGCQGF